jgi:MFS family permease
VLYAAAAALSVTIGEVRGGGGRQNVASGLVLAYRNLRLRGAAWVAVLAVAIHCMLTMSYQGMLPMFVTNDLHAGTETFGALLASIGLGAMIGSLGLAQFSSRPYRPALFAYAMLISGAALSVLGAVTDAGYALILGFFVGSSQAMFMSMTLAIIQSSVDDEFRGRATSIYQMITLTPMALFGWGMGGLADIAEPRPLLIACGIAFLVVMSIYTVSSMRLRALFTADGWILPSHVQPAPVTI